MAAHEHAGELGVPEQRSGAGGRYVFGSRRGRLLGAAFALVEERGYEGVSARSVAERAGMSNRTFYECFTDREDCFLAAFSYAVDGLELELRAGWDSQLGWTARVRGALAALLWVLDREPAVRRLVFVEALAAGPRVLARRARVLEDLAGVIDRGRENSHAPGRLPGLVAEGVVGGVFGVIHARLLELRPDPLVGLLGSLMAMIVLPYRGSTAAARELERPLPRPLAKRRDGGGFAYRDPGLPSPVDYRFTVRTQMALAAVGGRPGLNNREVSEVIGLADQGQISRMMKRLQTQGLVENVRRPDTRRQVRAWRLTADGEGVIDAHKPLKQAQRTASTGGRLETKSNRKHAKLTQVSPSSPDRAPRDQHSRPPRMTRRTREVLVAVADLSSAGANPSNRQVANLIGVKDAGQISKLLTRLQNQGLLENTTLRPATGNAWQITKHGTKLLAASEQPQTGGTR